MAARKKKYNEFSLKIWSLFVLIECMARQNLVGSSTRMGLAAQGGGLRIKTLLCQMGDYDR